MSKNVQDNENVKNVQNFNFDYECRKMAATIANVVNSFNLPFSLKAYVLDEISSVCKQQAEINVQQGAEKERKANEVNVENDKATAIEKPNTNNKE